MVVPDAQVPPPPDRPGVTAWALQPAPADPILSLCSQYATDTSPNALNLAVGTYRNAQGAAQELRAVTVARERFAASKDASNHGYGPLPGSPTLRRLAADLVLGAELAAERAGSTAALQTLSGSGALRVALEFARRHLGATDVLLPDPTWPNHHAQAEHAGLKPLRYRYYDAQTWSVRADRMVSDLRRAPPGSVVVLHACAHNPTGCDLTRDEWARVADVVSERRLVPLVDLAYQGLASGDVERDAFGPRLLARNGPAMLAVSFAKNFGLYGERVGALVVLAPPGVPATRVQDHLSWLARGMYSTPPRYGAALVESVLGDPALRADWLAELREMVARMDAMRGLLVDALLARGVPGEWPAVRRGGGMFAMLGLSEREVVRLREEHHVYLPIDSRINVAGLTADTVDRVADAVAEVVAHCRR